MVVFCDSAFIFSSVYDTKVFHGHIESPSKYSSVCLSSLYTSTLLVQDLSLVAFSTVSPLWLFTLFILGSFVLRNRMGLLQAHHHHPQLKIFCPLSPECRKYILLPNEAYVLYVCT